MIDRSEVCLYVRGHLYRAEFYVEPADYSVGIMGEALVLEALEPAEDGAPTLDLEAIDRADDGELEAIERAVFDAINQREQWDEATWSWWDGSAYE